MWTNHNKHSHSLILPLLSFNIGFVTNVVLPEVLGTVQMVCYLLPLPWTQLPGWLTCGCAPVLMLGLMVWDSSRLSAFPMDINDPFSCGASPLGTSPSMTGDITALIAISLSYKPSSSFSASNSASSSANVLVSSGKAYSHVVFAVSSFQKTGSVSFTSQRASQATYPAKQL